MRKIFLIPAMMLIGTGLVVNNAKAVLEAVFGKDSPFLRTPKKGELTKNSYRPFKDITWLVELFFGAYCMTGLWLFIGFSNAIVSPFLLLYASGFLFVGFLSIIHYRKPELISLKLRQPRAVAEVE